MNVLWGYRDLYYKKHSQVLTCLTDDNKASFRSGQSNIDLMPIGYKSQVLS